MKCISINNSFQKTHFTVSYPYFVIPRFVATMRMGAMSDSRARFRNEKHSMSSMWTSSIKSTCYAKEHLYFSSATTNASAASHRSIYVYITKSPLNCFIAVVWAALEVWSQHGAIQVHVYLILVYLTNNNTNTNICYLLFLQSCQAHEICEIKACQKYKFTVHIKLFLANKTKCYKILQTPGTISAFPSSRHSATLAFICSRTSDLISPVSPASKTPHQW